MEAIDENVRFKLILDPKSRTQTHRLQQFKCSFIEKLRWGFGELSQINSGAGRQRELSCRLEGKLARPWARRPDRDHRWVMNLTHRKGQSQTEFKQTREIY